MSLAGTPTAVLPPPGVAIPGVGNLPAPVVPSSHLPQQPTVNSYQLPTAVPVPVMPTTGRTLGGFASGPAAAIPPPGIVMAMPTVHLPVSETYSNTAAVSAGVSSWGLVSQPTEKPAPPKLVSFPD